MLDKDVFREYVDELGRGAGLFMGSPPFSARVLRFCEPVGAGGGGIFEARALLAESVSS